MIENKDILINWIHRMKVLVCARRSLYMYFCGKSGLSLKEDNMAIILLGVIERPQLTVYKEPVALR